MLLRSILALSGSLSLFLALYAGLFIVLAATCVGEDTGTLEEVYEPFLIKEGFIQRTPRGRVATEMAYKHLGLEKYMAGGSIFDGPEIIENNLF